MDDAAPKLPPEEGAVPRPRGERRLDDPGSGGIDHDEVRGTAGLDRAAVIGGAEDPRGRGGEPLDRRERVQPARVDELGEDDSERGLEPDRAGRSLVELDRKSVV